MSCETAIAREHYLDITTLRMTYGTLYDRLIQILYIADLAVISYFAKDEYEPEVTTR
jgi:hypothetical protein